jgi:hypothetical protein
MKRTVGSLCAVAVCVAAAFVAIAPAQAATIGRPYAARTARGPRRERLRLQPQLLRRLA